MAMDSNKVSQGRLLTQDSSSSVGTMHEWPDDGGTDKEFDLQKARKKLKALQHKVSPEDALDTPKVLLDTPKNEKFAGKSLSNILMVELYAGSARLSKACQQVGCGA
jgi:hypothetical protein